MTQAGNGAGTSLPSLYYYRNRFYSPYLARFTKEDPIGNLLYNDLAIERFSSISAAPFYAFYAKESFRLDAEQNSIYAYADGNPIDFNDPTGLLPSGAGFCGGDECEEGWKKNNEICRKMKAKLARKLCYARAMIVYGDCLAGRL